MQATIDARYYFGEPVNGAKVKYAVYRSRYWFPLWYDPDEDMPPTPISLTTQPTTMPATRSRRRGQTGCRWQADHHFPTTVSEHKFDYRLPHRSARHRPGQSRDHRPRLGGRDLRQLRRSM